MKRRSFVQTLGAAALGTVIPFGGNAIANRLQTRGGGLARRSIGGRVVTIAAEPAPISIDAARTAILVIDMQNDFGSEGGSFHRAGIDISMIRAAVPPTARVLAAARASGMTVIYLKMAFRSDLSDAGSLDSPNYTRHLHLLGLGKSVLAPTGRPSRLLIRDTWNTDIVTELTPHVGDIVLYKHRFSGFYETELDAILKRADVKNLIVTGCTTSICVESTIRDAMFRDYSCILLKDCTGEPIGHDLPRTNHSASLLNIQSLLGWVSASDEFVKTLSVESARRR